MSVSVTTMGLAELATFLAANSSYATVGEAMATLNIVIVEDVGAAGTALAVTGGPGQLVVGTVGETALEVAAQSQLAATGTGVSTSGIGLLQGQTSTGAAALLGMDLGVAGAACAPILGVALGVGLYESNPELWTKISKKLLPFCYPGTTKIPTWAEIVNDAWQVSIPKKVVDALKEFFDEEGIGGSGKTIPADNPYGADPITCEYWSGTYYTYPSGRRMTRTGGYAAISPSEKNIFYVQATPFDGGTGYTRENKTVYYEERGYRDSSPSISATYDTIDSRRYGITAWVLIYGPYPSGTYPEGTEEWRGTTPSEIPQTKPAVIGVDPTTGDPITQPMVPISPPTTAPNIQPQPEPDVQPETIPFPWPEPSTPGHTTPWPTVMPWPLPIEEPEWWPSEISYPYSYPTQYPTQDPETQPDPTTITEPQTQVQPYVQPLPIPWTYPIPNQPTLSDPRLDPSKPRKQTDKTTKIPPIETILDIIPPIGISPWPNMPSTLPPFSQNVGLVTVYHPSANQLYDFERWLWVTYADSTIDKIWNNPFDGVITLFELYCTPTDVGNRNIHCGFLDSGINSPIISRYTEIDCGTLGIPEYYGNYLDYSPYTKAHIYLPFIGVQELNPDDIVGHGVNVTYRIDEYNGSCIAMITVAKVTEVNGSSVEYSNTMYQFSGNCSVELPLAGGSQASIKAGMMMADAQQTAGAISVGANLLGAAGSALAGQIGGAISGVGGAVNAFAQNAVQRLVSMLSGKSTVQKSGSFGSSHGALGIKKPFITITRPKQVQVPNYNELYGYPSHKMVTIGSLTGFIRCKEVHVVSSTANDEEKALIEQLLKSGVYMT